MSAHCAICMEPALNTLAALTCGHVYHRQCIDTWTKVNSSCPQCKRAVSYTTVPSFSELQSRLYWTSCREPPDVPPLCCGTPTCASSCRCMYATQPCSFIVTLQRADFTYHCATFRLPGFGLNPPHHRSASKQKPPSLWFASISTSRPRRRSPTSSC